MSYKKSYSLFLTGVMAGALIVFIGLGLVTKTGLLGALIACAGLAAILGAIAQALIYCKCPKCGVLLKIRGKKPKCCHGCGYKLEL